jgi:hypothetical protein
VLRASDPNAPRSGQEALVQRGAQLFGIDLVAFANRMIPGRMPGSGDGRDKYAINRADVGRQLRGLPHPRADDGRVPLEDRRPSPQQRVGADLLGPPSARRSGGDSGAHRLHAARSLRDLRNGFRTLDLPRNTSDDALPNQGVANGKEFRTPPLMGIGRVGPPFFHDARVFLSRDSRDSFPLGTVYSDATTTNGPLVVRTVDDALARRHRAARPAGAGRREHAGGGGCPVPPGRQIGEVRYSGPNDICPPTTATRRGGTAARPARSFGASGP